jgi:hypothetical protein
MPQSWNYSTIPIGAKPLTYIRSGDNLMLIIAVFIIMLSFNFALTLNEGLIFRYQPAKAKERLK